MIRSTAMVKQSYRGEEIPAYTTDLGHCYKGKSEQLLNGPLMKELEGQVQLILTSPPFPLNKKKQYGNLQDKEYIEWLASFAPLFARLLTPDGSIVLELGNAWERGHPVQSLLPIKTLISFLEHPDVELCLCQEFICHNPSRLPSPIQWVNIERCRVTDSYTRLWWMAKTDRPKADNRKVLRPYSKSMKRLQARKNYNAGERPSGHIIGESSFLNDNKGSIMPNVIEIESIDPRKDPRLPINAFSISNTKSNDYFHRECRARNIKPHPARMPVELADFFVRFLTDPEDMVLDPFAGSNTTGFCAEKNGRRWVSIEAKREYIEQSQIRFEELGFGQEKREVEEGENY
jgi:hypothetical protein